VSPRVLVVDDEPALARALAINLRAHGWEVVTAADGRGALKAAAERHPDVVVLDLGLPDMDGTEVIAGLRGWTSVPIVVLSARQHGEDKIEALDLGADDFVNKPFGIGELMARLRTALRHRQQAQGEASVVKVGTLEIDMPRRQVTRAGAEVKLTSREFDLLSALARHPGKVMTHRQLLAAVWGPAQVDETQYLRVYIGHLRQKLEERPDDPKIILTELGIGYRLTEA
jgi:two-component system, OmpR family, KDP operon response regulator KdpE